jgi:cytochrome c553
MKKFVWLGVCAIIVLLLVILGPAFLDLYRLQSFITASSKADAAEGGPWPRLTDECTLCHGVRGNAQHQAYPRLAGQPAAYLAAQLHNFASGARAAPNMVPLAMTLSDADIQLLSSYFEKQTADANSSFTPDPRMREKGKTLVATLGCAACHGEKLGGHDQYPRLAGQGYDYLSEQLAAYATGTRSEPTGVMKSLTVPLSMEDRKAIATYLANYLAGQGAGKT